MLNHCIFQGRLVQEPELRRTETGQAYVRGAIAVDRNFKNKKGEKDTDFFNFIAWNATAQYIATYFIRGQMILLEGYMQNRCFLTQEGETRKVYELVVHTAFFSGAKSVPEEEAVLPLPEDDSIPFPEDACNL